MDIKPIETIYNGYRFRSRLEARWAVFFDAAGIEYEYEPEGFELDDKAKYLPDFYLPKHDTYAEVKAPREGYVDELGKSAKFVDGKKIKRLLILSDIPMPNEFLGWFCFPCVYYSSLYEGYAIKYVQMYAFLDDKKVMFKPDHHYLQEIPTFGDISCKDEDTLRGEKMLHKTAKGLEYSWEFTHMVYKDGYNLNPAFLKARQARFEYGECGK